MSDLVYLAVLLAFFVVSIGFIALCDRIIGPDGATTSAEPVDDEELSGAAR